ncbi:MAG TPA: Gldg family protein [Verrucomicrobiae bacterium]
MTKKNSIQTYLFSVVGVIAVFVILLAAYIIVAMKPARIDVTEGKVNTLSQGTRAILKKLDTPVQIRFFASQGEGVPVELTTFMRRVEDLLNEYREVGGKNIEIKKLNPEPDSDAEDAANLAGIEGQPLPNGERLYMGIEVSMLDSKVALPFLDPRRERLLEYDITRAIANVMTTEKQVVGVISGLPVFGQQMNPMMMQMGQRGQDPWIFISELKRDFTVREIPSTADKIDDDVKILVVVHPKNAGDKLQYAIDQFVLRGGKLIAFLDPLSIIESQSMPQQQRFQMAAQGGSNLEKLLKAWGLEFDSNKVVADMVYKTQMGGRGGNPQMYPTVLSLAGQAINTNDVVTAQITDLVMLFPGAFSGTPATGLQQTVLLQTTKDSTTVDRFMAEFSGENAVKDFKPSGKNMALAVRLVGKFKTAFPDGKPKDATPPEENKDEKKDEKKDQPAEAGLKESKQDTAVILVGDSDILADQFGAQVFAFGGQKIMQPLNGNFNFFQNAIEQLSGDNNLIAVRSRATQRRPFTKVAEIEAKAQDKFREKIQQLQKSKEEAQTRFNELQRTKQDANQRFIVSPEQQAEIDKLRQKQVEVNRDLKKVNKDLRKEVNSLENTLKWANILGMPAAVALAGIVLALLKRKKTAAK